ncbi:nicotinate-nucleotide adenylyltransferase [Pseudohoeflea suaedae]|uniref:Probable nicotinate-nucleotide adenylyltransferase n=1 Tax=Pseudohoeflea suaedae TaxID=877384 RepID=A0A4R5PS58_9HYPH|nr:nicotinate-nucleotide adenylyltransferase [Pseudohoeflea suaedae]TDH39357.1 nicotinate-nucleotide adenylyltransferase [Pseudohoeflea suaedae]
MPHVERGMKVGLFGGSFNPPHAGHVLVSEIALRRLGLDQIWWMVSPGNPLKDHSDLEALEARVTASNSMVEDPRVKVTAFEAVYGLRYTAETLDFLKRHNPGIHFVWVMGADNLASFHRWQDWRGIAQTFPIAVIDRPGSTLSYLSAPMAKVFSRHRLDESDARRLPTAHAPAWTFIHGPRSTLSSTAIRKARASRTQGKKPETDKMP